LNHQILFRNQTLVRKISYPSKVTSKFYKCCGLILELGLVV